MRAAAVAVAVAAAVATATAAVAAVAAAVAHTRFLSFLPFGLAARAYPRPSRSSSGSVSAPEDAARRGA